MSGDPILIPCEGGGCAPIRMTMDPATFSTNFGLCSMCGTWHPIGDGNVIDEHQIASLWVTTEVGPIHLCCGPVEKVSELGERHLHAGTAVAYETGPCCQNEPIACAFDTFGETHDIDKQVILSLALARAEGRDIGQPWRCARHGALTFGGCCEPAPLRQAQSEQYAP